ncbi:MAG TPA: pseudouridine synthase, partial [Candidatus Atribacteria bacterium]|nr:pseudouridine synthase [Candidatus Atribacteria bacterium]
YNTVANGLVYYFQSKGERVRVRPVSRLDKDTSGIIIFAKNQFIQDKLTRQMLSNVYRKEYLGIVHGCPREPEGTIDLPIARVPGSTMLRMISEEGARCITHYKVIEQLENAAMLKFVLETGRTHQIRVHCKAIGHPLIGDTLYSDIPTDLIARQALHSHYVRFIHPLSGKPVKIRSELPEDMDKLLKALGSQSLDQGSIDPQAFQIGKPPG